MKKNLIKLLTLLSLAFSLTGCGSSSADVKVTASANGSEKISTINTYIELGDTVDLNGITTGVSVSNNIITIQTGGTYCLSGTLADGQIIVDAKDSDVNLVLNGVNITCSNSAPIYIKDSDKTVIALADESENIIIDGEIYNYEDKTSDEPDSAIYSKDDITFIGSSGSLTVNANYNDGIKGKDDLVIEGGNITVNSLSDGIVGKDSLTVSDGNITLDSGKDGLKSSNETDEGKGNITINGGSINIVSEGDGIQGINNVVINDGEINLTTGGGSENAPQKAEEPFGAGMRGMMGIDSQNVDRQNQMQPSDQQSGNQPQPSAQNVTNITEMAQKTSQATETSETDASEETSSKGIKSDVNITINGGNMTIDSCDDAVHSNDTVTINKGIINISSGDDGIHADSTLDINDGEINVSKSYEGLESQVLNINGGNIYVTTSDDGINAGGGSDGSASACSLNINGGYVYVDAAGDGLDANGSIYMTDGLVIVNGPTDGGNGALDYDQEFIISGGNLISAGSNGMVQAPSESSTQNSIKITLNTLEADTIVRVESEDGKEILTFAPSKQFASVVISSPEINSNTTYKVYTGGSYSTEDKDGLYEGGSYSDGKEIGSASVSSAVTSINEEGVTSSSGMGRGGNGGMKGGAGRQNFMNQQTAPQAQ